MAIETGTRLGSFEVVGQLGVGGMGEVYRARDTRLDREVAIKVLPDAVAHDTHLVARFEREAKLLAALNHPHIAAIHDLQHEGDTQFLVMELVEGLTLAERLHQGPFHLDEAIEVFGQIAQGLDFAHDRGIVHRDLKPANVKITPEGSVKILDFGLAKAFEPPTNDSQSEAPTLAIGSAPKDQTEEGTLLGTPAYMSPEQARGRTVDKRTDIWAYGCCLFEALTGERPFRGETRSDLLAEILKVEPKWDLLPEETPSRIRDLLWRCLQKDPRRRLRDIGDAWFEMSEAQSASSDAFPASPPPTQAWSLGRTGALGLLVTGLVVGAVVTGLIATRGSETTRRVGVSGAVENSDGTSARGPVTRLAIPLPWGDYLGDAPQVQFAASPDGLHVAYSSSERLIHIRSLEDPNWRTIRPPTRPTRPPVPFFSPDSKWLGYAIAGAVNKVALEGDATVKLTPAQVPTFGPRWAWDNFVYYSPLPTSGVWRVSDRGGKSEQVFAIQSSADLAYWGTQPLPGRDVLLTSVVSMAGAEGPMPKAGLLFPETGEVRTLVGNAAGVRYVSTGHLLFTRDSSLMAVPFDLERLQTMGAPVTVVDDVETGEIDFHPHFDVSDDGTLFYVPRAALLEPVWVDLEGNVSPTGIGAGRYASPRVSPDGGRILLRGTVGPRVHDLQRSSVQSLESTDSFGASSVWSSDGQSVYYETFDAGAHQIAAMNLETGTPPVRLFQSPDYISIYSSSSDGRWLTASLWKGGMTTFNTLLVPTEKAEPGTEPIPLGVWSVKAEVSPNGRWIAYTGLDLASGFNVYVQSLGSDRIRKRVSPDEGGSVHWSPDGRTLYYRKDRRMLAVSFNDEPELQIGEPRVLFEDLFTLGSISMMQYDLHPDGQRFLMLAPAERDPQGHRIMVVQNWFDELNRLVPIPDGMAK